MLILSDSLGHRHLSETRIDVCPIRGTVFVLIGRRFRTELRRRHLHHIGGWRVAGGVPCMNPVVIGRARIDGHVAEGRDMRFHLADLYELLARAVTFRSPDAKSGSADPRPAFGPCQNHLATADGDRHQIDRRRRKGGRRRTAGHASSSMLRQVQVIKTRPVGAGKSPEIIFS